MTARSSPGAGRGSDVVLPSSQKVELPHLGLLPDVAGWGSGGSADKGVQTSHSAPGQGLVSRWRVAWPISVRRTRLLAERALMVALQSGSQVHHTSPWGRQGGRRRRRGAPRLLPGEPVPLRHQAPAAGGPPLPARRRVRARRLARRPLRLRVRRAGGALGPDGRLAHPRGGDRPVPRPQAEGAQGRPPPPARRRGAPDRRAKWATASQSWRTHLGDGEAERLIDDGEAATVVKRLLTIEQPGRPAPRAGRSGRARRGARRSRPPRSPTSASSSRPSRRRRPPGPASRRSSASCGRSPAPRPSTGSRPR